MEAVSRERATQLYATLTEKTRSGDLKWDRMPRERAKRYLRGESSPANVFRASYEGANWLLAEYELRRYRGEDDTYYYETDSELALLADDDEPLFTFPYAEGYGELLNAVKAQAANVPALLDRVLGKMKSVV